MVVVKVVIPIISHRNLPTAPQNLHIENAAEQPVFLDNVNLNFVDVRTVLDVKREIGRGLPFPMDISSIELIYDGVFWDDSTELDTISLKPGDSSLCFSVLYRNKAKSDARQNGQQQSSTQAFPGQFNVPFHPAFNPFLAMYLPQMIPEAANNPEGQGNGQFIPPPMFPMFFPPGPFPPPQYPHPSPAASSTSQAVHQNTQGLQIEDRGEGPQPIPIQRIPVPMPFPVPILHPPVPLNLPEEVPRRGEDVPPEPIAQQGRRMEMMGNHVARIQIHIDALLVLKLAVAVALLSQGGSWLRFFQLCFLAVVIYLYQTGNLRPLVRLFERLSERAFPPPPADGQQQRNLNPDGAADGQEAEGVPQNEANPLQIPVRAEPPGGILGFLKGIQQFVLGFIASLLPGFVLPDPELAPQGEVNQQPPAQPLGDGREHQD